MELREGQPESVRPISVRQQTACAGRADGGIGVGLLFVRVELVCGGRLAKCVPLVVAPDVHGG